MLFAFIINCSLSLNFLSFYFWESSTIYCMVLLNGQMDFSKILINYNGSLLKHQKQLMQNYDSDYKLINLVTQSEMSSKDDFNQRRRISRSSSLLGDSFKMGASLIQGLTGSNKAIKHLTLDNVYSVDKDQFQQKQQCSICFVPFNKINRRHHCRICGKSCCTDCSGSTINKERACDICINRYQQPQKIIIKEALLERLKINAVQYLGGKAYMDDEYKRLQIEMPNQKDLQEQRVQTKSRIQKLQIQIQQKRKIREKLQKQLEQCKAN